MFAFCKESKKDAFSTLPPSAILLSYQVNDIILVFSVSSGKLRASQPHSPFVFFDLCTFSDDFLMITLPPFPLQGFCFILAYRKHSHTGCRWFGLPRSSLHFGLRELPHHKRASAPPLRFYRLCASQAKWLELSLSCIFINNLVSVSFPLPPNRMLLCNMISLKWAKA